MRCPTCGFAIDQPNLAQCPNCGNALPAPAGQMEHTSQGAQGPTPPEYQPYLSYAPYPPSLNYPGGYGQPYGQPAPPSYPYPGAPGYPPAGYPQPLLAPLPVRKRRTGLIVGIVAAVVVVLAACTWGTLATVQALHAPSSTTRPHVTIHPYYTNSFTSGDDLGWSNGAHCFLKNDGYHVKDGYVCFGPGSRSGDVYAKVDVRQISGSIKYPFGISFRWQGDGASEMHYDFAVTSDGRWLFAKCNHDSCDRLVNYRRDSTIHMGTDVTNTLELYAKGSHMDFWINGKAVGSADDSSDSSGWTGIFCGSYIECAFTNLELGEID